MINNAIKERIDKSISLSKPITIRRKTVINLNTACDISI